jgi:predicted LPLAT superfamily acyltransferase
MLMEESLLSPWKLRENDALFERIQLLSSRDAWKVLSLIRMAEIGAWEQEEWEYWRQIGVTAMAAAPKVAAAFDIAQEAAAFATWSLLRGLDLTFVGLFSNRVDVLPNNQYGPLDAAVSGGRGVLVVPFHTGSMEAATTAVAIRHPTTMVVSKLGRVPVDVSPIGDRPNIPSEDRAVVRTPSPDTMLRLVAALRAGRVVMMPPSVNVKKESRRTLISLPFLGAQIKTSESPAILAQRTGAPVLPVAARRGEEGGYELRFFGPYAVGEGERGRADAMAFILSCLESVLNDRPGHWEGWVSIRDAIEAAA